MTKKVEIILSSKSQAALVLFGVPTKTDGYESFFTVTREVASAAFVAAREMAYLASLKNEPESCRDWHTVSETIFDVLHATVFVSRPGKSWIGRKIQRDGREYTAIYITEPREKYWLDGNPQFCDVIYVPTEA